MRVQSLEGTPPIKNDEFWNSSLLVLKTPLSFLTGPYLQGPSTSAVPVSTDYSTVPQTTIPIVFRDFTAPTFTPTLEQSIIDGIQATLSPVANVNISLINIIASDSVSLVVSVIFLDGSQAAAKVLFTNANLAAEVRLGLKACHSVCIATFAV